MEKYLFHLISNKHLCYIVIEYVREKNVNVMKELEEQTTTLALFLNVFDNNLLKKYHATKHGFVQWIYVYQ